MEQEVLLKIGVDSADVPKAINATKALEKQIELLAKALDQQRITQRQSSDGLSKIVSEYRKMGVNALDAQDRVNRLNLAVRENIAATKAAAAMKPFGKALAQDAQMAADAAEHYNRALLGVAQSAKSARESASAMMAAFKEQDEITRAANAQSKAFGDAVRAANTYASANKSAADSAEIFARELQKAEQVMRDQSRAFGDAVRAANTYATANKSAADSASVFVEQLRKQEAQAEKTARANQEQLRALQQASLANKSAADSAEVFIAAARAETAERIKLEALYNKSAAAARVYEQAVENLNRAEQLGVITADKKAAELQQLNQEYQRIGTNAGNASRFINQFGDGASVAGIKTNKFGMYAQQVGYQVGDFFVQIQSGTNAFVAFGQQATQLAGLLPGLAGAIVGIGISVATTFLAAWSRTSAAIDNTAKSMENFKGKLASAEDAIIDMQFNVERLKRGFEDADEFFLTVNIENAKKRISEIQQQIYELELMGAPTGPNQRGLELELASLQAARDKLEAYMKTREEEKRLLEAQEALDVSVNALETVWSNITKRIIEASEEYTKLREKADDSIASFEREAELNEAILKYGRESAEVAAVKKKHYMDGVEELIREVKAGDELAKNMRTAAERAYDTSQAVDGLEDNTKESAKAASILALEFERAAAAVMNINVPGAERLAALNAELNAYNRGLSESQVRIQQASREAEVAARKAGVDSPAELAAIAAEAARIEAETIKAEEGLRKYTETSRRASTITEDVAEQMTEAQKAAKEYADTMNGYVVGAVDGVADAFGDFVTRGFKDFKGFVNSVLGSFKNMIAQMIAYAARNQIMIGLGMGGVGLGTATAAAAGIGGAGTMIGGIGGVVGAGGFLSGVAGGAGAALGIGGYTSAGLFNVGANAAVASAATGAGAFASTLGAALPVIGAVAGIFSFLKKKTTVLANGISVMADETDALVQEFRTVRTSRFWGLSKKVRTSSFEAAPEVADPIRESIDAIYNDIFSMMETIGIASENYLSKILSFEVNLKDLSEQEQLEKIAEALGNFAIEAAEGVQGLSLYRKRNEELLDTLKRLSSSVFVARNAFEALGSDIFEVTMGTKNVTADFASIEATRLASFADALVESTGGVERFAQVTSEYFENFFSDAERLAFQTEKVGEEFAKLGIEMPTSKEAFRELVEGITSDLEMAIKSNRSDFFGSKQTPFRYEEGQIDFIDETTQLLAALLNLSPAFNSLFQNTEDLTDAINGLDDSVARQAEALNERLLRLRGDIEALRDLERATMLSPENLAILEQIFDLEDEIEAAKEATRIAEERLGLERKLLELNGDTAAIRALELAALDQSNRALQEQIWAIEDKAAADAEAARIAEAAAAEARRIADERAALERQLLDLNGDVAAIRSLELAALAESNRALQEQIWAIQDKAAADEAAARAAEEAAAAARAIAEERAGLERQLLELNGDVAAIRALELAALDASNRALQEHIWAIQDKAAADAEAARVAAEAAAELQRISDERATLERRYYELIGNTEKLREIELAGLDATNRKYLEFIFVLEDLRDRTDAAKAAAAELAEQERRLSEERADLERRYYELTGNTAKIREMELAAIDEANKKYLEFIFYLEDLEQATEAARRVVEERNSIEEAGLELQRQLLELQGNYAAARQIELAQRQAELLLLDESNMQRHEENQALQDSIDIQQEANKLRDEERALLIELYTLQGNIDAARQIELMIREEELLLLDETNVAAQIRINALKDEINALRGVTEAIDQMNQASEVMNQRNTILRRIYGAVDDTGALREMEMADILEENKPLQEVLYRVEDDIKAQQKAISAAEEARQKALEEQRKMEQVASERDQLITRALTLQGKTDELRQREIDAMDPLNQAMQLFIYKLEDAKKVLESINEIDFATKLDYDRAVARARAIMQAPLPELAPIPEIVIPEVPKLRLPNVRGWISEALGGNTAGVPGFAEGGYHSGGLRLVGENGPELEVTGPSRIYSNSDTKAMLGGDPELRREVEDLKVLTIQNAKYIKRTYDIYRKWDVDGLPTERDA